MRDFIGIVVGLLIGIPLACFVGLLLGAWYGYWPLFKSKPKRCKDCRWTIKKWGRCRICQHPSYSYETKEMTDWCLGYGMNALAHKLYGCDNYTRKRWKFWRSK